MDMNVSILASVAIAASVTPCFAAGGSSAVDRINALEQRIESQQREIDAQRLQIDAERAELDALKSELRPAAANRPSTAPPPDLHAHHTTPHTHPPKSTRP